MVTLDRHSFNVGTSFLQRIKRSRIFEFSARDETFTSTSFNIKKLFFIEIALLFAPIFVV